MEFFFQLLVELITMSWIFVKECKDLGYMLVAASMLQRVVLNGVVGVGLMEFLMVDNFFRYCI
jgi:hypothetical protein